MNPDLVLLERILWSEVARSAGRPGTEFDERSPAALAIGAVLSGVELHSDEAQLLERWDARRETGRVLLDRLLQARVNRALGAGRAADGRAVLGAAPRVVVVRAERVPRGVPTRPHGTLVEILEATGSLELADLAPGARIDELVDLLVLANQGAVEELRASLPSASVLFADGNGAVELHALRSPSVRVLDVERALEELEELLSAAIPPERRPARSGDGGFLRDLSGELLGGKYRVKALKGKGAFKTVYEGEDEMLGARVAIAVLNPKGARSERSLAHFQDEARLLTTLDHENIVRWITFDRAPSGLHYFVMEYLDGEELEGVLRREGRLAPARVGEILLQVLAALKRAHTPGARGSLLHLDLKPENVFLLPARLPGEPERVKVIDFGIGQHVGADARAAERDTDRVPAPLDSAAAVRNGDGVPEPAVPEQASAARRVPRARGGTLLYASPEQCRHLAGEKEIEALDGRSDLYSLGVMAFRMLTGQFPFADCASVPQAIRNHLTVEPRRVGSLGIPVPRALAAFVDRCLVKDRTRRWSDAAEAHAALERIVHPRRSPLLVALPVLGLAMLGLGWIYATRARPVSALTLVDPRIADVAERAVSRLSFGPRAATRVLGVETDFAWDPRAAPPVPRLVDAQSGGPAAGWSVRWSDAAARTVEIEAGPGSDSLAAMLELSDARHTWRTPRLALTHLGSWRIESATVEGHDGLRRIDPRGRRLAVLVAGDPEGRTALESIALEVDGTLIGEVTAVASPESERAAYAGPPLDALFTGAARSVELRVRARDRAGQEEELSTRLELAGEPADFAPGTGFVGSSEARSPLLPASDAARVLLRGHGLCIRTTSRASVRVSLEPEAEPRVVCTVEGGGDGRVLTLAELGLDGEEERRGTLRLELDDDPWVERTPRAVRVQRAAFFFTPRPPRLEVVLQAGASERVLSEASSGAVARVNVGPEARLLVRPPPGTDLWLEGAAWPEEGSPAPPVRLARHDGPFELPLALAHEGRQRIALRSHVLLAGDEKGPWIPPEHAYLLEVDRTSPRVELEFPGPAGASLGPDRLFTAELPDGLRARVTEGGPTSLRWTLERPGAASESGALEPESEPELWPRIAAALGPAPGDGRYALVLDATDEAGNRGEARLAWHIARTGPELGLLEPLITGGVTGGVSDAERRWVLGTSKVWNVRVRAEDKNGVAAVSVHVRYRGRLTAEIPLVASLGDLWEIPAAERPSLHSWWSGQELALEVHAEDRAGQGSIVSWSAALPEVQGASRLVIAPRNGRGASMVEVVAGVDYTFGGRSGEGRRAWNVRVPGASFPSYLLDAREVSRAEFQAFVLSADGYADPRWWPSAGAADEMRREAWREALAGGNEPTVEPVTGVTWPEATAYAAWRGKRLPTLVEWEFAVRGPEYRAGPAHEPLGVPDALDWPANLCDSAREWTSTPARLGAGDFGTQGRRNLELLLRADTGSPAGADAERGSHWIAGGPSGERDRWATRAIQTDGSIDPGLGFRCALDRAAAQTLLETGAYEERE